MPVETLTTTQLTAQSDFQPATRMPCETASLWIKFIASMFLSSLTFGASGSLTLALFVLIAYTTTNVVVATLPIEDIPKVLHKSRIMHQ